MQSKKLDGSYALVLGKGEKLIQSLEEFCQKEGIRSAHFKGLGAASQVELGHFSLTSKKYTTKVFEKPLEIVSLAGTIAMKDSERIIHCHVAVGDDQFQLYGGHLVEAIISVTCEIIIRPFSVPLDKRLDPETGLNLLNFD